jgi:hypothetical protein
MLKDISREELQGTKLVPGAVYPGAFQEHKEGLQRGNLPDPSRAIFEFGPMGPKRLGPENSSRGSTTRPRSSSNDPGSMRWRDDRGPGEPDEGPGNTIPDQPPPTGIDQ